MPRKASDFDDIDDFLEYRQRKGLSVRTRPAYKDIPFTFQLTLMGEKSYDKFKLEEFLREEYLVLDGAIHQIEKELQSSKTKTMVQIVPDSRLHHITIYATDDSELEKLFNFLEEQDYYLSDSMTSFSVDRLREICAKRSNPNEQQGLIR